MFEPILHDGRVIGHALRTKAHTFFFGTREVGRDDLSAHFAGCKFAWLSQVHGNQVTSARPGERPEADAHVTDHIGVALGVITADCVPVLLASRARVAGIHAGWRGVAANVIGATLTWFTAEDPVQLAVIGPHLGAASFEVGLDVADRLARATPPGTADPVRPHRDPAKRFVDLRTIVRAQINAGPATPAIAELPIDTLTSSAYHSYRRDGAGAGRNLSFVVRNA